MSNLKVELSEDLVKDVFTNYYNLGEITYVTDLESGHESDNVKVTTSTGDYVLKLLFHELDIIEDKMNLSEILSSFGVKIPIPIRTKTNGWVVNYDENNLLVVHTFIPGESIYRDDKEEMYSNMKWFGKQFGIFHYNSKKIPLEIIQQRVKNKKLYELSLPPGEWIGEQYNNSETILPEHEKNNRILELFEEFIQKSQELKLANLSTGIIHGDLFPGNFLMENGKLTGIIDFGGANFYYLMADLGTWVLYTTLYDLEVKERFQDFIIPYLEYSKVSVDELKTITFFFRARAFVQYFYFAYRINNNITQGNFEEIGEDNWKGFTDGIFLVEAATDLVDNYFYDVAIQAINEHQ